MTRITLLAGVAVLSLTLAACGQKTEDAPVTAPESPSAEPVVAPPAVAAASAPDFVTQAAISDMFEIEAGRTALKRSTNADVKAFAQMMVDGHSKTSADLKAAASASGLAITPPAELPEDKREVLSELTTTNATEFDRKYMDSQVKAHETALDLMSGYAEGGDNATLKATAAATVPVIQQHLDKARTLRDALK